MRSRRKKIASFIALYEFLTIKAWSGLSAQGDSHISKEILLRFRDNANRRAGSIKDWLEGKPPKKQNELTNTFADLWEALNQAKPDDPQLLAFECAVLDGGIGKTNRTDSGSFCVNALMAYKAYDFMLNAIIELYDIPVLEREMPLYTTFDPWLEDGFYREENQTILKFKPPGERLSDSELKEKLAALHSKIRKAMPEAEAFREKVRSCCEVCRELDDACRANRQI